MLEPLQQAYLTCPRRFDIYSRLWNDWLWGCIEVIVCHFAFLTCYANTSLHLSNGQYNFSTILSRDALTAIFPDIKTLMCSFHVVNCCKKESQESPNNSTKIDMWRNKLLVLCYFSSWVWGNVQKDKWEVEGDMPEFAWYFNNQWVLGNFTQLKIFCSESGIASTNNALNSFNNIIKRYTQLMLGAPCQH